MSVLFVEKISQYLSISKPQVKATIELLESGATIPFISRYRKEATGSLDEVEVSAIQYELRKLEELVKRKEAILKSMREQEVLTSELENKINNSWNLVELEDIYLPFKPKRKTKASVAKEKGLEPLAKMILGQYEHYLEDKVKQFVNDKVPDVESAFEGARDIIAEWINENTKARNVIRSLFEKGAVIHAKVVAKKQAEASKYQDYFDHHEPLDKIPGHRLLAIRRGEEEGFLKVSIDIDEEKALHALNYLFIKGENTSAKHVKLAIKDCYKRLLSSSIETEFANLSKEKAEEEAIHIFSENLRQLLMSAPLGPKRILAIDPGFRTGCKVVCLNEQGNLVHNTTIYPHPPQNQEREAGEIIQNLIKKYQINAFAIGNGTAGRETEKFIKSVIGKTDEIEVFMVNEAGASIYSASEIAREEFADLDLTVRGAISIGRRLMDPLAELVKIDAKSIGVGQYQHDVNQELLKDRLDEVVSSVVNQVGVNLNTASQHLLRYISGIGPKLAKSIVTYRTKNGSFKNRKALMEVDGLGAKAFEQSAGFLRIKGGENPLDNSAVHPEAYSVVQKMLKDMNFPIQELIGNASVLQKINVQNYVSAQFGLPTLKDVLKELEKPGLDPRGKAELFSFAEQIHDIKDLKLEMVLPGVVTNLAKFGAFVDIGIKENGLLHISQISNTFIKDPAEVLKLDQKVMVKVVGIDLDRKRIQLSMK
jgi:uncharacterized protein